MAPKQTPTWTRNLFSNISGHCELSHVGMASRYSHPHRKATVVTKYFDSYNIHDCCAVFVGSLPFSPAPKTPPPPQLSNHCPLRLMENKIQIKIISCVLGWWGVHSSSVVKKATSLALRCDNTKWTSVSAVSSALKGGWVNRGSW